MAINIHLVDQNKSNISLKLSNFVVKHFDSFIG